ncbi:MAG TPA: hypothetical protein VFG30_05045 [Polyangiales bacterium]|nr:hypothetical protein [Polyangiales bacterium]
MQPSWLLADGTRVELRSVANRADLGLFAPKHWSARVNGAAVPTDTRILRGSSSENLFKLPDGREAIARVLSLQGARICDLSIGDQTILYPGKLPFTCPGCRNPTEPHERTCAACKAEQPSYDARLGQLQRRSVASSLLHLNLTCIALGVSEIVSTHPVPAFASLHAADVATQHLSGVHARDLQQALSWLAAYMLSVFGCAWLALDSPVLAALLNVLAFACMLTSVLTPDGSWFALGLAGVLMYSTFATAERAIDISHRARQRQLATKPARGAA